MINPFVANGLAHCYHLGELNSLLRGVRRDFEILFNFSTKCLQANRIAPDGTLCSAASHIGYTVCQCPIMYNL